ncbi:ABC transporter permease [Spelaeicoccus albus]
MAVVIFLITLLVVLLSGLAAGLGNQSIAAVKNLGADHMAFSRPASGDKISYTASTATPAEQKKLAGRPGVDDAALIGVAMTKADHTSVSAFGVDPGGFAAPDGVHGRSIVVDADLAADQGWSDGDRVAINGTKFTVAGTKDDSYFNHQSVIWMDRSAWTKLPSAAGADGTVVALRTSGSFDAGAASATSGMDVVGHKDAVNAVGSYTSENGSLTLMQVILMAVSALVVGAFFTIWTIQRSGDLAVLKAMGAATKYLLKDALGQALLVLVIGGGLGALFAGGLGLLAAQVVPFIVTPMTTLVPLAVVVVLGMLGASAALHRISTVDPLTALGATR